MLVVGPNSTCDICMESYMDGTAMPHAITCGHIFCRACLDWMQPQCPLCRVDFSPRDIRRLRVDTEDTPTSTKAVPHFDRHIQRLLDDIAKIAGGGATVEEIQKVIGRCNDYHNTRPNSPNTPLSISYLLLCTLLEAQRKLLLQADQLSELAAAKDHIRDRLTWKLQAAQLRNQDLEETGRSEKECALRNAENARVQYDKMNALWKCKMESIQQKYQSLHEELDRLRLRTRRTRKGKEGSVADSSDSGTLHHATTTNGVLGVVALDEAKPPAFRLGPYFILVFNVILASVGCVLFLHATTVVLQLCAKRREF